MSNLARYEALLSSQWPQTLHKSWKKGHAVPKTSSIHIFYLANPGNRMLSYASDYRIFLGGALVHCLSFPLAQGSFPWIQEMKGHL